MKPLFHIPFDRDYRLVPAEADEWTEEQFDAFYEGVAVGIGEVEARLVERATTDKCTPPCYTLLGHKVDGGETAL